MRRSDSVSFSAAFLSTRRFFQSGWLLASERVQGAPPEARERPICAASPRAILFTYASPDPTQIQQLRHAQKRRQKCPATRPAQALPDL
jgi:hypothetical protein